MEVVIDDLTSGTLRADGKPLVHRVRIRIPSQTLTVVVGPSGAGKSSLLDLITGVNEPLTGTVRIGPNVMHPASQRTRARLRARVIATARQDDDLLDALTVAENVDLGQRLSGFRDPSYAAKTIAAVGLRPGLSASSPAQLSGGERRRVAVARAIASGNAVVACDEPTSALDEDSATLVRDLLRRSADAGRTIVAVTHDLALARSADAVVRFAEGALTDLVPRPSETQLQDLFGERR